MTVIAITLWHILVPRLVDAPDAFVDTVVAVGCVQNRSPDRAMVVELLEIEAAAGVPDVARGITVAAACRESGFGPAIKGDWRLRSDRRVRCKEGSTNCAPRALGMFQHWYWARKGILRMGETDFHEPREDWRRAAEFWARHIVKQVPRVRRVCKYESELDVWKAAHRTAVTSPSCVERLKSGQCVKFRPRCHKVGVRRKSSHWSTRDGWYALAAPTSGVLAN